MSAERKEDWRAGYARVVPEGEWVNGKWHSARCRCPHCDPDDYNDSMRDLGYVNFGGRWIGAGE